MNLPRPRLREDVLVHLHEMGHIRRSAETNGNVWVGAPLRIEFRRMAEEIAVECTSKIDIRCARDHLDWTRYPIPTERHELALQWLQLRHSKDATRNAAITAYWEVCARGLDVIDRAKLDAAYRALVANPAHLHCEQWADELTAHFSPPVKPLPQHQESKQAERARVDAIADELEAEAEAERAERRAGESDQTAEKRDWAPDGDDAGGVGGGPKRGARDVLDVHMHLTARRGGRTVAAAWRTVDTGTVVRRPELLVPSGRIFAARASGGGLLIDYSGSMRWSPRTLMDGVKKLPRLWAGAYSGPGPDKYAGRLCVVARDGRMGEWDDTAERAVHTRGNCCDWLALEYMVAHAPRPYVWVSDGCVLDSMRHGYAHPQACDKIMARHGIVRVLTLDDAIRYLLGQSVYGWTDASSERSRSAMRRVHR